MADYTTSTRQSIRWLGLKEAAEYCGISINKMRELFFRDNFPGHRIGNRHVVKIDDLDRYIKEDLAS